MQNNFISNLTTGADSNFDTGLVCLVDWLVLVPFFFSFVVVEQYLTFFIPTGVQVDFEDFLDEHKITLLFFYYFEWSPFAFQGNI